MVQQIVRTLANAPIVRLIAQAIARIEWRIGQIGSVIAQTIEPTELKTDNRIDRTVSKTDNNISRIVWIAAMRFATTLMTMPITTTVGMEEIFGARTHAAGISTPLWTGGVGRAGEPSPVG